MRRGRRFEVEWQESAEQLAEAYRSEKHVERRMRLQAQWQLREGKSLEGVSQVVGVSYRTLQRWVAWYRSGGLEEVLRRVRGYASPGGRSYLTAEQAAQVKARADQGAFRTAQEAARWIEEQWGVRYRYGGIYGLLYRLDLRKKVPRPQAEQASPEAQAAWKKGASRPH